MTTALAGLKIREVNGRPLVTMCSDCGQIQHVDGSYGSRFDLLPEDCIFSHTYCLPCRDALMERSNAQKAEYFASRR